MKRNENTSNILDDGYYAEQEEVVEEEY